MSTIRFSLAREILGRATMHTGDKLGNSYQLSKAYIQFDAF